MNAALRFVVDQVVNPRKASFSWLCAVELTRMCDEEVCAFDDHCLERLREMRVERFHLLHRYTFPLLGALIVLTFKSVHGHARGALMARFVNHLEPEEDLVALRYNVSKQLGATFVTRLEPLFLVRP